MGTQEITQRSFSPLLLCVRNEVKVNTEGPEKGQQLQWRSSVYVKAGRVQGGGRCSLSSVLRWGARLSTRMRGHASNTEGESRSHPFWLLHPSNLRSIPKPRVFVSTPRCFLVAWTRTLRGAQGSRANGHSPSSSKRSPMCPCASASFFPPSILISWAI